MKYKKVKLGDVIEFNPKETLKKNDIAKKIPMDALTPFTRKIDYFELSEFKGGTKFKNNDTLMARITPCLENGKTSFVDVLEENEVGFGSTEYFVLRAKEEEILPKYLYYLSISKKLRSAVIKSMTGTSGRQRAQKESLLNFQIFLPNITDQKKILGLLDSLDTKIELNNQMITTLEEVASALFKRWFVDFEFPDENGNPYKSSGGKMIDSELGEIPEEWKVKKISEVSDVKIGKTPPRKESKWFSKSEGLKWVSIADLGKTKLYVMNTKEKLTLEAIDKKRVNVIPKNTVLLSFKLTVGRLAITTEDTVTNEAIASFINSEVSVEFLYLYLKEFRFETLGNTSSIATAINSKIIRNIPLLIPKNRCEEQFLEIILPLFVNLKKCVFENNSLEELRDSLIPKLLSGEIEV